MNMNSRFSGVRAICYARTRLQKPEICEQAGICEQAARLPVTHRLRLRLNTRGCFLQARSMHWDSGRATPPCCFHRRHSHRLIGHRLSATLSLSLVSSTRPTDFAPSSWRCGCPAETLSTGLAPCQACTDLDDGLLACTPSLSVTRAHHPHVYL